jgi:hypothetical protein
MCFVVNYGLAALQSKLRKKYLSMIQCFFGGGGGGGEFCNPLFLSSSLALQFSQYSFLVHHPINPDDRHLLTHAMASDFSVTWQFSQIKHLFLLLWIKLHALSMIQGL